MSLGHRGSYKDRGSYESLPPCVPYLLRDTGSLQRDQWRKEMWLVAMCSLLQKDAFISVQREMNFAKKDECRVNNERSTSCNKLQHTATHCNKLCIYVLSLRRDVFISLQREMNFAQKDECRVKNERTASCNKLQQAVTHYNTFCMYVLSLQRDVFISLQREMNFAKKDECRVNNERSTTATSCNTLQHTLYVCALFAKRCIHLVAKRVEL